MRHIEIIFSGRGGERKEMAVALDVLRATTTIIAAFDNGALEIIPAADKEEALALSQQIGDALLAGESESVRLNGFDLGNSPLEYVETMVGGKKIILTTTNGTRLLRRISGHRQILIGALQNLSAIAKAITACEGNLAVFCAGRRGSECFEDNLAAGAIVSHLVALEPCSLDKNAERVLTLFEDNKNCLAAAMRGCEHGKRLFDKGFGDDVKFCSRVDASPIVPVFDGERIKILT